MNLAVKPTMPMSIYTFINNCKEPVLYRAMSVPVFMTIPLVQVTAYKSIKENPKSLRKILISHGRDEISKNEDKAVNHENTKETQ